MDSLVQINRYERAYGDKAANLLNNPSGTEVFTFNNFHNGVATSNNKRRKRFAMDSSTRRLLESKHYDENFKSASDDDDPYIKYQRRLV